MARSLFASTAVIGPPRATVYILNGSVPANYGRPNVTLPVADIETTLGAPIPWGQMQLTGEGKLPRFLGPDGVTGLTVLLPDGVSTVAITGITDAEATDLAGAFAPVTGSGVYGSKFTGRHTRRPSEWFAAAPAADTPVLSTISTTSGIASPRAWPSVTTSGSSTRFTDEFFSYNCAGARVVHGASSPDFSYIRFTSLTNGTQPGAPYAVDFDCYDSVLELRFKQLSGVWKISVNGRPVYLSWNVELLGGPTGGTFTLTVGGQTTTALAYNATLAQVQAALVALSSVGAGNAVVAAGNQTGTNGVLGSRYLITLTGAASGQAITAASSLTGGTSASVDIAPSAAVGVAQTSGIGVQLLTFPTADQRRIRFESVGLPWGGVNTSAIGTISPAQMATPRPRVICVGDSYAEGANNNESALAHWPRWLGEIMGWDDVWSSGAGGTGWMNPSGIGGRVKFRDRLATDVIPFSPDLVIYMGGHNDTGYTPAQVQSEITLSLQQVAASLPNCVQVVLGPIFSNGLDVGTTASVIALRDAMKAGTVAAGVTAYFVDPSEMPVASPVTTTMAGTIGLGSSGASLTAAIPVGAWIEFDGIERRRITALSGVGPYTATLNRAVSQQHLGGTTVRQVGPPLVTGSGYNGAPAADGNADVITGTDTVHPSRRGQKIIGVWVASALSRLVLPAA